MSTKLGNLLFSIQRKELLIPKLNSFLRENARLVSAGKRDARLDAIEDAKLSVLCFKTRQDEYNHDDPATADYFHPSAIGQCMRKLWFQRMKAPDNGEQTGAEHTRMHLIFEIGTYAHVMLQNLIERAGMLERREVPIRNDIKKILGHADGILKIDGKRALLEIKTINTLGFGKLLEAKPEHIEQATVYMEELKLDLAIILYFDKNTAQLKEFLVRRDVNLLKNRLIPRIASYHTACKTKTMPDREGTQPAKFPCAYCEFSGLCFSSLELQKFLKTKKLKGQV